MGSIRRIRLRGHSIASIEHWNTASSSLCTSTTTTTTRSMATAASSCAAFTDAAFQVQSPGVTYTEEAIEAQYAYETSRVVLSSSAAAASPEEEAEAETEGGATTTTTVTPVTERLTFRTERRVPKLGVMLVGWGGNNGSTVTGAIIANKLGLRWHTKEGEMQANYTASMTMASTVRLGTDDRGRAVYIPFRNMLPMVHPNDFVIGGWDISAMNLADAMERAQVLDYDLQRQLRPHLEGLTPLPSIYDPDFIAANQGDRADNVLEGTKSQMMGVIRQNIADFKESNQLDKVIVLWTANTERFAEIQEGVNDTADNLLESIEQNEAEIAPSTLFAVASIQSGCSFINGSPQNTFVPGVIELAERENIFIGGDDFKSGQTKMKSVLVDFLVSAGIKPTSIVSYNHLGNNDGKNLSAPQQFRSKEISKSNVVDDMVASNRILYDEGEHPDHCVVIKYVPYVGDSKRAMDEYTSEIFMGGRNTIAMHNTCEDSLLASPLIIDLVLIAELCERITIQKEGADAPEKFHAVLSLLSYMLKAPLVPPGTPVINALFAQRQALINVFRACVGLPAENHMLLEHKLPSSIAARSAIGSVVGQAVGSSSASGKTAAAAAAAATNGHANGHTNGAAEGDGTVASDAAAVAHQKKRLRLT